MKLKLEIKSLAGQILFSFETEGNTIAKTVTEAVRCRADLRSADLRYANLRYADLRSADLQYADLRYANLQYADLRYANLQYADLRSANLQYANLRSADLQYANLCEVKEADLAIARTRILPEEGDIIGWKKCSSKDGMRNVIVKLLIPGSAKRSHAFGRKCRASEATVLEIIGDTEARSQHEYDFIYRVGDVVKPRQGFSEDWCEECAPGIHFFITKIEAENY